MELEDKKKRGRPKLTIEEKEAREASRIERLGGRTGHRSKKELAQQEEAQRKKAEKLERPAIIAEHISTKEVVDLEKSEPDLYDGLTDQQKVIARLKMRGLSQSAISKVMNVSQPYISKMLRIIREHQAARGKTVDQNFVVGETMSIYEEIESKAWELYHSQGEDKAKALSLILTAREKQTKLLMDLGRLEKASSKSEVSVNIAPFLEKWEKHNVQELAHSAIQSKLSDLEAPEPPDEDEIEDAIIVEEDEDDD